jgi:predicted nuclease of restriction endonuclease-like RecB superfamily
MEISGPLSILTSTKIYGHALGRLVPFLVLAEQFTFEAAVRQNHAKKTLVIRQGDPIFPKEGLKKFDSQLERKFYDAFLKATDDWNLTREPEPLVSGQGLVFPDFSIWHKVRPDIKYYLEIVGFWTKEYLSEKMSKYALVSDAKLILCVNEKFAVDINELPSFANIVWFKRSIKPSAVLEVLASDG